MIKVEAGFGAEGEGGYIPDSLLVRSQDRYPSLVAGAELD